jgi:hypothetical protein
MQASEGLQRNRSLRRRAEGWGVPPRAPAASSDSARFASGQSLESCAASAARSHCPGRGAARHARSEPRSYGRRARLPSSCASPDGALRQADPARKRARLASGPESREIHSKRVTGSGEQALNRPYRADPGLDLGTTASGLMERPIPRAPLTRPATQSFLAALRGNIASVCRWPPGRRTHAETGCRNG